MTAINWVVLGNILAQSGPQTKGRRMTHLRLAFLLLIWPLMANADNDPPALPALFEVIDVARDDTLNVRQDPNGAAPIVTTLPYDASDLEIVQLSLEGNWAYLSQGDQSGWVSVRFLQRQPMEQDATGLPPTLTCFGTEPFWSMQFTGQGLALSTPQGDTVHPLTTTSPSAENVNLSAMGFRFEWMMDSQRVRSHILPGLCNDGMSDTRYGLHYVDNLMGNTGCCSL